MHASIIVNIIPDSILRSSISSMIITPLMSPTSSLYTSAAEEGGEAHDLRPAEL